jgi:hypothetical protein
MGIEPAIFRLGAQYLSQLRYSVSPYYLQGIFIAGFLIRHSLLDPAEIGLAVESIKVKNYPRNRPWRPIGL